jgi:hypothetical protein
MLGSAIRTSLLTALLFALAAGLARGAEPGPGPLLLDLSVVAGGGYDSNLAGARGGATAIGSSFATARADAGALLELSGEDALSLNLGYEGSLHARRYQDLDEHRPSLNLSWLHAFGERLTLRFSALGALRFSGDSDGDGWDAATAASLRLRLLPRLTTRWTVSATHRNARDPAFASDNLRGRAALELDLWWRSWLALSYAADVGQATFYQASATSPATTTTTTTSTMGAAGSGPGAPASILGGRFLAYRDDRVAHTLSADLTQPLPGGFFLQLGYGFSAVRGKLESYDAHAVTAEVGWRR